MKNLKCINPKEYKLTQNKLYETEADGEFVTLTNDNGVTARYHQSLFEEVVAETTLGPYEIEISNDVDFKMLYIRSDVFPNRSLELQVMGKGSAVSCGLAQMFNINGFCRRLHDMNLSSKLNQEVFDAVFTRFVEHYHWVGQVLLSTNISENDYINFITELIDGLPYTVTTVEAFNPNSGNNIRTWIVTVKDTLTDDERYDLQDDEDEYTYDDDEDDYYEAEIGDEY